MTLILNRRAALVAGTALLGLGAPALAQARRRLTVATGGTGGVYFVYGGGLARVLTEKVPNVQATSQVTGGSVDNINLLSAGDADIGFSTLDSVVDALNGVGAYARGGKREVRIIAVLYDNVLHAVATPAINSVAEMKGKRIGVGSAGSSTEGWADRTLEAAGLNPKTDIIRDNLGVAESANALADGKIAGFFWGGGVPTAAIRDLAQSGRTAFKLLDTSKELVEMNKKYPGLYRESIMPPNSYPGQTQTVSGIGVANVMLVDAKAPNDLVTLILEGIFNNLTDMQAIHPEARKLTLQTAAVKLAAPFHPAAEAFYKARGVSI
ncbi:TAXI family TRAP transporter solute-binding subunit [Phreatobacter oligotrophus]|uniref:TAXI family TRAP transporter solute-binding subunit n=1 Tax=Phreatobacter oligotrophus TaxID=1122261 RepID=UPI002352C76F|nr:TAXI family TRAP transporter solute-binding subunit [Phreatobacter oligotrophus]MBX9989634.1 TAXI family TRAP transporter solute-binding subunit [Phreatobacter oligotrophus]